MLDGNLMIETDNRPLQEAPDAFHEVREYIGLAKQQGILIQEPATLWLFRDGGRSNDTGW